MSSALDPGGKYFSNFNLVVIENISPQINHGKFAVKLTAGEELIIQADLFSSGNSSLTARILYKHESEKEWHETSMYTVGNDRWEGRFSLTEMGVSQYFIKAWVDPVKTWQNEVNRRVHQYFSISELIPEGLSFLEKMAGLASKADKPVIKEALRLFKDTKRAEEAGQLAASFRFTEWLNRYPDTRLSVNSEEFCVFVYRKKVAFGAWYTMFPRSAAETPGSHGSFQDVIRLLPRIANLGFDVLHFPPVHPIGTENRKGRNGSKKVEKGDPGSPFAIGNALGGHEAIHSELGSPEDFSALLLEAENEGIEIALDFALTFSPDHPWVQEYPDWFVNTKQEEPQTAVNPVGSQPDYFQIHIDETNWVKAKTAVVQVLNLWAGRGVRIFRVVQSDRHPFAWWQEIIREVISQYPETIFYAGTVTRPKIMNYLAKSGFALSDSYFMWRNGRYELEQYINELAYSDQKNFFKPIFRVNTPDLHPFNLQSGHESQQLIRFFLAATLSGVYGIYGPVFEQLVYEAFPGKEEYWNPEKYEIKNWDWEKETKITYLISMINRIRKTNTALQQTNRIHTCEVQNDQIMAYLKIHQGNKILCVVNLNAEHRQAGMVRVPLYLIDKNHDETYVAHDLITDARYEWKGEWNYVELDPHILPFHLLRIDDYHGVYH